MTLGQMPHDERSFVHHLQSFGPPGQIQTYGLNTNSELTFKRLDGSTGAHSGN